jgi:hypothetical protein
MRRVGSCDFRPGLVPYSPGTAQAPSVCVLCGSTAVSICPFIISGSLGIICIWFGLRGSAPMQAVFRSSPSHFRAIPRYISHMYVCFDCYLQIVYASRQSLLQSPLNWAKSQCLFTYAALAEGVFRPGSKTETASETRRTDVVATEGGSWGSADRRYTVTASLSVHVIVGTTSSSHLRAGLNEGGCQSGQGRLIDGLRDGFDVRSHLRSQCTFGAPRPLITPSLPVCPP